MSGCSGHIHVSLRDASGRNIFAPSKEEMAGDGRKDAKYKDLKYLSQEAEWFLGGLLEGLPDGEHCLLQCLTVVIPMMCPTINSYKRLLGGEVSSDSGDI